MSIPIQEAGPALRTYPWRRIMASNKARVGWDQTLSCGHIKNVDSDKHAAAYIRTKCYSCPTYEQLEVAE